MSECVLSLDQSLRVTGYAVFDDERLIDHGVFSVDEKLPIDRRLNLFMRNVQALYNKHKPDVICFEDIQDQNNVLTFKRLAYVQAAILIYCSIVGGDLRYEIISPSHWRSVLGGGFGRKREDQKRHAIEFVKEKYGIDVDSDTADAICIGTAYIYERKA